MKRNQYGDGLYKGWVIRYNEQSKSYIATKGSILRKGYERIYSSSEQEIVNSINKRS